MVIKYINTHKNHSQQKGEEREGREMEGVFWLVGWFVCVWFICCFIKLIIREKKRDKLCVLPHAGRVALPFAR